jgi:hypothetical protein
MTSTRPHRCHTRGPQATTKSMSYLHCYDNVQVTKEMHPHCEGTRHVASFHGQRHLADRGMKVNETATEQASRRLAATSVTKTHALPSSGARDSPLWLPKIGSSAHARRSSSSLNIPAYCDVSCFRVSCHLALSTHGSYVLQSAWERTSPHAHV